MSSESVDFTQEPKKVFLSFLIKQLSLAHYFIYVTVDEARGLNVLDGLIDSLNEASKQALKDEHDQAREGSYSHKRVNTRELYAKVATYLSKTYLEECNFSTIPTSSLKCDKEAPSEKIPERLSAKI